MAASLENSPIIFIKIDLRFQVVSGVIGLLCDYGNRSNGKHKHKFNKHDHTEITCAVTDKPCKLLQEGELLYLLKHAQISVQGGKKSKGTIAQNKLFLLLHISTQNEAWAHESKQKKQYFKSKSAYLAYNMNTKTIYRRCRKPRVTTIHSDGPSRP